MVRLTRSHVAEDRPLAHRIGGRLREERHRAGLTQAALAAGRYTKSYVSALENGLAKPSMAALNFFAERLGIPIGSLVSEQASFWTRVEADVRLARGEWQAAADAYESLLEGALERTRGELLRGLAEALCRMDQPHRAIRVAAESAALLEAGGRPRDAAWASYWHAFALYQLEQSEDARRLLERLDDALATGTIADPDLRVRVAIARAMVETRDDEPERALTMLEGARNAAGQLDDRRRATFLFSLAVSYREVGDLEAAVMTGQQSLAHFRAAAAELEAASIENELALVYLALGHLRPAHAHAEQARAGFEHLGNERWLAHVTETEAQIALAEGHTDSAAALARRARSSARDTENRKAEISANLTLARALRELDQKAAALDALEEAAALARKDGRRAQLQMVLGELAEQLAASGQIERAFAVSQEAVRANRIRTPARAAQRSVTKTRS